MNKRKLTIILISLASLIILSTAVYFLNQKFHFLADTSPLNIYVAIDGNDNWSGSISKPNLAKNDGPLATVERARDKIRELKASGGLTAPINIKIKKGTYELAKTLELTNLDSGTNYFPITYEGYGGKTIISGGEGLKPAWAKCSASDPKCLGLPAESIDSVYYTNAGTKTFNSLFVNDARATRARTPNEGQDTGNRDANGKVIGAGFYNIAGCKSGEEYKDHFLFRDGDISSSWKNLTDVEAVLLTRWRTSRYKILSVGGNRANIVGQSISSLDTDYCQDIVSLPGTRYFLDNVFEGLDTAGEWYLDKSASNLFYYPKQGEDITASIFVLPKLDKIIDISGSSEELPASNIKFKNIVFQNTDWSLPDDQSDPNFQGLWDIQSLAPVSPKNQTIYRMNYPSTPAIFLNSASGIEFSNNLFENLGGHALQAYHTTNLLVKNNEFKNLGMNGIVFGDSIRDESGTIQNPIFSGGITISSNIIHDLGQVNPSGVGVLGLLAKDSTVSNNHIYNGGYDGIQIGWDWSSNDYGANRIKVDKNVIHSVSRVFNDGAGIYMVGSHLGSSMSSNLVHNVERTTAQLYNYWPIGLYLDNNSTGITQENNIVFNNNLNLNYNGNRSDIVSRNNIAVSSKDEPNVTINQPFEAFSFTRNIIYATNNNTYMRVWGPPSEYKKDENGNYVLDANKNKIPIAWNYSKMSIDNNLYFLKSGGVKFGVLGVGLANFSTYKTKTGLDANTIEADPQFSDPSSFDPNNTSDYLKRDYSLKPTSPALVLGFKQIDTSNLGPQGIVGPVISTPSLIASINITDNQTIASNPYIISVTANDPSDVLVISKVEFYIDNTLISTSTLPDVSGTYQAVWDTSKYHSVVKVILYNTDGTTETVTRNTTVNLSQNYQSPIVNILPMTGEDSAWSNLLNYLRLLFWRVD